MYVFNICANIEYIYVYMHVCIYICMCINADRSHVLVKPIGPHFFIYPTGFTKHVKFTL